MNWTKSVLVSAAFWISGAEKKWLCMKEFPQWWPKLDFFLSASFSASLGWEDSAPPGACHVDRAASPPVSSGHVFFFFFFVVALLSVYLFGLFHAYHHVCSWWYRLLPNSNLSRGWYYSPFSFSSRFSCSSLHPFTALRRGGARIKQFFFHVSRI